MVDPMERILLPIPADWIKEIDRLRGEQPRAEFIRECIRTRLGRRKFPATRGRGRPPVEDD